MIEARDICLYLKPLQSYFDQIESLDFNDIQPKLRPMLHCICLTWANSRYYCTTTRIIILLREVSNLLIAGVYADLVSRIVRLDIILIFMYRRLKVICYY